MRPTSQRTQRNDTQRNDTQRNDTQRNDTQPAPHRRDFHALIALAVGGLLTGCGAKASGEDIEDPSGAAGEGEEGTLPRHACATLNSCAGQGGCSTGDNGCRGQNTCSGKGGCATVEHHTCSGLNSCAGEGGCGSGDNGCKGKNSCSGKGGCGVPISH